MPKAKTVKLEPVKKAQGKGETPKQAKYEVLLQENLAELTKSVQKLSEIADDHVFKTASIANHVIAIEELLSEVIAVTGINLPRVNQRIRRKINARDDASVAADTVIDIAAGIVSKASR